ncbi:MAG: magnesium transporter [Paracoccaceae bacterium]|nr:magnesium transporter [Paracoccaceae bacterium]
MLTAYRETDGALARLASGAPLAEALWIDLYRPSAEEAAAVSALGVAVPSLIDMEEIEISNRLTRVGGTEVMTVVLPGMSALRAAMAGPVSFLVSRERLVTVRHHVPRPFETFPARADRASAGCASPAQLFLGLGEEIVARLADLLEGAGAALDRVARGVYGGGAAAQPKLLQEALEEVGRQGELLGRVRLGLLTMERAIDFFDVTAAGAGGQALPEALVHELLRDIHALEVHVDFLGQRVALITDATLGMINLSQNNAVKGLSVVAAVFLPPTLIATVYGMNFTVMPELSLPWGYPGAVGLMIGSAVASYLFFRWKKWL